MNYSIPLKSTALLIFLVLSNDIRSSPDSLDTNTQFVVKKTISDLCHTTDSPYYKRILHYELFPNLRSCLESGGLNWKNKSTLGSVKLPYNRARFGSGWAATESGCQDIRDTMLSELSLTPVKYDTPDRCKVSQGRWYDFYSGKEVYQATNIDIDHIVPLKWAWDRGASAWDRKKRVKFANDVSNLVITTASINRSKGDSGLTNWLPKYNRCQYILKFLRIQKSYELAPLKGEEKKQQEIKSRYCPL